jgi:hypothetical protein
MEVSASPPPPPALSPPFYCMWACKCCHDTAFHTRQSLSPCFILTFFMRGGLSPGPSAVQLGRALSHPGAPRPRRRAPGCDRGTLRGRDRGTLRGRDHGALRGRDLFWFPAVESQDRARCVDAHARAAEAPLLARQTSQTANQVRTSCSTRLLHKNQNSPLHKTDRFTKSEQQKARACGVVVVGPAWALRVSGPPRARAGRSSGASARP